MDEPSPLEGIVAHYHSAEVKRQRAEQVRRLDKHTPGSRIDETTYALEKDLLRERYEGLNVTGGYKRLDEFTKEGTPKERSRVHQAFHNTFPNQEPFEERSRTLSLRILEYLGTKDTTNEQYSEDTTRVLEHLRSNLNNPAITGYDPRNEQHIAAYETICSILNPPSNKSPNWRAHSREARKKLE